MQTRNVSSELRRIYESPRTPAERFLASAKAFRDARGGRPTITIDPTTGRLVATYPDGSTTGATR